MECVTLARLVSAHWPNAAQLGVLITWCVRGLLGRVERCLLRSDTAEWVSWVWGWHSNWYIAGALSRCWLRCNWSTIHIVEVLLQKQNRITHMNHFSPSLRRLLLNLRQFYQLFCSAVQCMTINEKKTSNVRYFGGFMHMRNDFNQKSIKYDPVWYKRDLQLNTFMARAMTLYETYSSGCSIWMICITLGKYTNKLNNQNRQNN